MGNNQSDTSSQAQSRSESQSNATDETIKCQPGVHINSNSDRDRNNNRGFASSIHGDTTPSKRSKRSKRDSAHSQEAVPSTKCSNARAQPNVRGSEESLACERVVVFMVRHGERIDETFAGRAWRRQAGDRWFDPPLTANGRDQAFRAAMQLQEFVKHENQKYEPFRKVYASPLLRTIHTAEQFGKVLGLPVEPIPGLATCTAAFQAHGADRMSLLPLEKLRPECTQAKLEPFSPGYTMRFHDTIERLCTVALKSHGKPTATGAPSTSARVPTVLIVTHREGLRQTSMYAGRPFRSTKYCCVAEFHCTVPRYRWLLAASPDEYESSARAVRVARKRKQHPNTLASEFRKIKEEKQRLGELIRKITEDGDYKQLPCCKARMIYILEDLAEVEEALHASQAAERQSVPGATTLEATSISTLAPPPPVVDWNADGDEIIEPPPPEGNV